MINEKKTKLSVILPCLNEEEAIEVCLKSLSIVLSSVDYGVEVIVVDNNSDDNSLDMIKNRSHLFSNLKIVTENNRGYGYAYLSGLKEARGDYIYMADMDNTYDFGDIPRFVERLDLGADMVIGNRFTKSLKRGSMSFSHRYIGNPVLSSLVRTFFNVRVKDVHCGARAFKTNILPILDLKTGGMEFASEMIIKAAKVGITIDQIDIVYNPRIGESKLKSIRDGWRHLRFILLYSSLATFFIPGLFIFLSGLLLFLWFLIGNPQIFGINFYIHPLFFFSLLLILGYQIILFGFFAKIYAINHLGDSDKLIQKLFKSFNLEKGVLAGLTFSLIGITIFFVIFFNWVSQDFPAMERTKISILALTLFIIGAQTFFASFMLSMLGIKKK